MKRVVNIIVMIGVGVMTAIGLQAQTKIDDQRMLRDIEVAENVLSTLMRQQFNRRNFFPFDVKGTYTEGYGVTFRVPMEVINPMIVGMSLDGDAQIVNVGPSMAYSYSYSKSDSEEDSKGSNDCVDCERKKPVARKDKKMTYHKGNTDSLSRVANDRIIGASKDFMADYGDMISQLSPNERIKITNRHEGDGQRFWFTGNKSRRQYLSIECSKGDIAQFRQGKITRDQLLAKITVIDSEPSEELSPDLELLSTMFNRLYSSDLSKTYYVQDNIYYERLKNYGAVYYMQVYSSNQSDDNKFDMATANLENITKAERDKKVKELYPMFEKDVKENMLDYGRTVKSLKDEEILVFNIKLTQCAACGIPSTLELSVKNSVLRDFSSGKLGKDAALALINVKKGPNQ